MIKAGAQRYAAEHGLMLVAPDTSPRGLDLPGEDDDWDFGSGAGFYLDATREPWSGHYRTYSYVTEELPAIVEEQLPRARRRQGHLRPLDGRARRPDPRAEEPASSTRSVSAFAPICAPTRAPWGEKAFSNYLGPDEETWREHDASELVRERALPRRARHPHRPGHGRRVPRRAALPRGLRGGLRGVRPAAHPPLARGLRPQLLLHLHLHGRPRPAPRQDARLGQVRGAPNSGARLAAARESPAARAAAARPRPGCTGRGGAAAPSRC